MNEQTFHSEREDDGYGSVAIQKTNSVHNAVQHGGFSRSENTENHVLSENDGDQPFVLCEGLGTSVNADPFSIESVTPYSALAKHVFDNRVNTFLSLAFLLSNIAISGKGKLNASQYRFISDAIKISSQGKV